jgi:hypothetical protein
VPRALGANPHQRGFLPRSKQYPTKFLKTVIEKGASIGVNSTIIGGITIGKYAMIGVGSIVTKDIPDYSLWYGNPAEFKGFICQCGSKLDEKLQCNTSICKKENAMLLEIKKEKNKYVMKNPPTGAGSHFFVEIETYKIIRKDKSGKTSTGKAYKAIKELAVKYPDDEFLKISLLLTPPTYEFEQESTDELLLNEALTEKYGL